MTDHPPSYDKITLQDAPAYTEGAEKGSNWDVIATAAKGTIKRSISMIPGSTATTFQVSNECQTRPQDTYKMQSISPVAFDAKVFELDDMLGAGPVQTDSSAYIPETIFAKTELSIRKPEVGTFTLITGGFEQQVFVDGVKMNSTIQTNTDDQSLFAFMSLVGDGQIDSLPFAWQLEPQCEVEEAQGDETVVSEDRRGSLSFWKKDKSKPKLSKRKSVSETKLERQKAVLGSRFTLVDKNGNIYASFENEFRSQDPRPPRPSVIYNPADTHSKWGILTIHGQTDGRFRAACQGLEKWSDARIERLIVMSFVTTLEINLRLQGGTDGQAYRGTRTLGKVADDSFGPAGWFGAVSHALGGGTMARNGVLVGDY